MKEGLGDMKDTKTSESRWQMEDPLKPTSSLEAVYTKTYGHNKYELGFNHSTYAWKDKEMTFPIAPLLCQNSSGVNQNY